MKCIVKLPQVAAFRLARHHLLDLHHSENSSRINLATLCRNVCGVQAQLMTAAQMALWARKHDLTRSKVHTALYKSRVLVKTSVMRQTLHLLPAADFSIYINALKKSRNAALWRIMSKFGIQRKEVDQLIKAIVAALKYGPMTPRELTELIFPATGKHMRAYLKLTWGIQMFRPALVEGLICYGPERGKSPTFVRVDQWLPQRKEIPAIEAQQILFRQYLRAYGPATLQDFSRWSGVAMAEVKSLSEALIDELVEVGIAGKKCLLLQADLDKLLHSRLVFSGLRLLPGFDPYLLGHVVKDHLVDPAHYKRVYRNQGWISPVILRDGKVIGIWSHQRYGNRLLLKIEPFARFSKSVRIRIEEEGASLTNFLETPCEINYVRPRKDFPR